MAKRVAVVLSGCGHLDGAEISEAVLVMVALDRAGAEVICAAPDVPQAVTTDHRTGEASPAKPKRSVITEAARIARGRIKPLSEIDPRDIDALVFPGGQGVGQNLSNWAEKGEVCEVDPDVARLLRACLAAHKPMGFACLAPILAARVLGPVSGVRITLGPRGTLAAKHAAVMGADVRPCPANEILIDQKSRVITTPAFMYDEARLAEVAAGIEKMVRTVLSMARDRAAQPAANTTPAPAPKLAQPAAVAPRAPAPTPGVVVRPASGPRTGAGGKPSATRATGPGRGSV